MHMGALLPQSQVQRDRLAQIDAAAARHLAAGAREMAILLKHLDSVVASLITDRAWSGQGARAFLQKWSQEDRQHVELLCRHLDDLATGLNIEVAALTQPIPGPNHYHTPASAHLLPDNA